MTRSLIFPFLVASSLSVGCTEYDIKSTAEGEAAGNPDGSSQGLDDDGDLVDGQGGIKGRICAPDGQTWVAGATVTVETENGTVTATTDGDGAFDLQGLPPGEYEVVVKKGSFTTTYTVVVTDGEVTSLAFNECTPIEQGDVEIAVITGMYDSIHLVLDDLGMDYDVIDGVYGYDAADFLANPSRMGQYDIIFFNCGMYHDWTAAEAQTTQNVRNYIRNGGSVYASDWAYWIVERSYTGLNDFVGDDAYLGDAYVGNTGMVPAAVRDTHMRQVLGSGQASINYDLPSWVAMTGTTGETLIEGQYGYSGGSRIGPLATRGADGAGTVLYTSFHNEQQTTLDMDLLLQEIILSL